MVDKENAKLSISFFEVLLPRRIVYFKLLNRITEP